MSEIFLFNAFISLPIDFCKVLPRAKQNIALGRRHKKLVLLSDSAHLHKIMTATMKKKEQICKPRWKRGWFYSVNSNRFSSCLQEELVAKEVWSGFKLFSKV